MLISCTICGDLFTGNDSETICCTPCGHSFHYVCLMNWFERVKSCPQCRQKASEKNIVKLYFSLGSSEGDEEETPEVLRNKVDNLTYQIRMKDMDIKNLKESKDKFSVQNKNLLAHVKEVEDKVRNHETVVTSLQNQIKMLKVQSKELSSKKLEVEHYKEQMSSFKNVEKLLSGTLEEGSDVLKNNKLNHDHLVRSLNFFKREVEEMKKKISQLREERNSKEKKISDLETKYSSITKDYRNILSLKGKLEQDLEHAEQEIEKWKKNCLALQKTNETLCNSDSKSKLIQRLIQEEPAPANFKNYSPNSLNVTNYDISTPSPIEEPKVRDFMQKKTFNEPLFSFSSSQNAFSHNSSQKSSSQSSSQKSSSSSASINSGGGGGSSNFSFSGGSNSLVRKNRFTLDPFEKLKMTQQCKSNPDEFYDGFGGHSKVDVFPQPKMNFTFNSKKKKVSNINLNNKKKKLDEGLPKISSFLKTFDLTGDDSD